MNPTRKVLVVTGGSRGVGAAVARLAARQGYAVAVNYREREDAANAVVRDIGHQGGTALAVRADVSVDDDVLRLFRTVDTALGPVTALVNNAAIVGGERRVDETDLAAMEALWTANISSAFLCAREAILRMSTRHGGKGGVIVNLSSMSAKNGGRERRVHYSASKGAINAFTVGLAKEVASEGIRVCGVSPGLIDTDIHLPYGGPERVKRVAATLPLGRAASAEEIAGPIVYLLSPEASYITGTIVEVSGAR